jgi:transcriptional regulator with XRE-family HTH domain
LNEGEKLSEVFGQRLKEQIDRAGLNQKELATRLGFTKSTITGYIQGRVPKSDTLNRLADMFGVSVDYLLGRETDTAWLESLPPELRELVANPNNRDILDVVAQLAKGGATADEIRATLKAGIAVKNALREIGG